MMHNQYTQHSLAGLPKPCPVAMLLQSWLTKKKIVVNEHGCWIWQGYKGKEGYGCIGTDGKVKLVHRVVFELCSGESAQGSEICHNCPGGDNPSCCNPAHLFRSTHAGNMKDAARKGRIKTRDSRGEKNPCAVLDHVSVRAMRKRAEELGKFKGLFSQLGREFKVSGSTASRVVRRKIWQHLS